MSADGICEDKVRKYCEGGELKLDPCADKCEIVEGKATCVSDEPVNECGDIPYDGICEDKTLKYCSSIDNKPKTVECPFACGPVTDDEGTYFDCVDLDGEGDCGDIDEFGICDGKVLKYCNDAGKLVVNTCSHYCGLDLDDYGFIFSDCLDEEPEACGDIDEVGICDGKTLKYCIADTQLMTFDCDDYCGYTNDDEGHVYSNCLDEPERSCGSIDGVGVCEGDTLKYCDDEFNFLFVMDCASGCGDVNDGEGHFYKDCL